MRIYGVCQAANLTPTFLAYKGLLLSVRVITYEGRGVKHFGPHPLEIGGAIFGTNGKSKKNNNKPKLNLTVREEQRNKLEQMASLENRSVSNLIEIMADERRDRLAEQQGIAYAKTVAEAMNLKLDMDNPADREKLRPAGHYPVSCRW